MSGRKYMIYGILGTLAMAGAGALVLALLPRDAQVLSAAQPAEKPETCTVSLVGDIMLASHVGAAARTRGAKALFAQVSTIFKQDDLTIGNFECAASTRGTPAKKTYTFRADPALLPALRAGGIEAVSVANNHALDYGRSALADTLAHLRRAGITPVGAGDNLENSERAAYFPTKGGTIALVAASRVLPTADWKAGERQSGILSAYDPSRLYKVIARAQSRADYVIVYLHWGVERAVTPEPYQRAMAKQCIRSGADAVIGSHPHVLQGFEYFQGKLIAYSLGNFLFTNHGKDTAILQLQIAGGKLHSAKAIPCRILRYVPTPVTTKKDRQSILHALQGRSYGVRLTDDGVIEPR